MDEQAALELDAKTLEIIAGFAQQKLRDQLALADLTRPRCCGAWTRRSCLRLRVCGVFTP